ncbi:hypothetical protein NECAME_16920, partial [Necator americanus]
HKNYRFERYETVPVLRPPDAPQRDYGRVQFEEGAQHKSIQIGMDNLNRAHLLKDFFFDFLLRRGDLELCLKGTLCR